MPLASCFYYVTKSVEADFVVIERTDRIVSLTRQKIYNKGCGIAYELVYDNTVVTRKQVNGFMTITS